MTGRYTLYNLDLKASEDLLTVDSMTSYTGDPKGHDAATFSSGMTGECLCGNIKVTITKSIFPKGGHRCHCINCRKFSGCVASNNLVIEKANVDISDPKSLIKTYNDSNTGSGLTTPRSFCSNCGRQVYLQM